MNQWEIIPLLDEYGKETDIIAIRRFPSPTCEKVIQNLQKKKKKWIGLSSYQEYPAKISNPYEKHISFIENFMEKYNIIFWCHCFRNVLEYVPNSIPSYLCSESDFIHHLPILYETSSTLKRFDFLVYIPSDSWGYYAKNGKKSIQWCNEMVQKYSILAVVGDDSFPNGVLHAKIEQLTFVSWELFIAYFSSCRYYICFSEFDASPRMLIESLALDIPVLVNKNILGGWKYVNNNTGMFFCPDKNMDKQIRNFLDQTYSPRIWLQKNYSIENHASLLYKQLEVVFEQKYESVLDGIIYINLDDRKDRRMQMELQLLKMEIPIEMVIRTSGYENIQSGHLGCCESHLKALSIANEKNWQRFLILEDDFLFNVPRERFLYIINQFIHDIREWSILLLFSYNYRLKNKRHPFFSEVEDAKSTAGYMCCFNFIETLRNNFYNAKLQMEKEIQDNEQRRLYYTNYAIDITWNQLQKNNKFFITDPLLGKVSNSVSSIMNPCC